jgi:hypothetical protein
LGQALLELDARGASRERKLRDRVHLELAPLKEATGCIVRNHYLHRGRTMAQLPYWVNLDAERVGVLLFALPRMSVTFQGHRPLSLLELARMWLDPAVQGSRVTDSRGREHSFSVATCAVGAALRRVREDWRRKYPNLPDVTAVVSWADQVHHEGTIYRAANFREVGTSGGSLHGTAHRPNGGRDQANPDYLHLKTAFLYEFRRPLRRRGQLFGGPGFGSGTGDNGVSGDKLAETSGRASLDANPMALDIWPADLGVVDSGAARPDVTEPL